MAQAKMLRLSLNDINMMPVKKIQYYMGFSIGLRELEKRESKKQANSKR